MALALSVCTYVFKEGAHTSPRSLSPPDHHHQPLHSLPNTKRSLTRIHDDVPHSRCPSPLGLRCLCCARSRTPAGNSAAAIEESRMDTTGHQPTTGGGVAYWLDSRRRMVRMTSGVSHVSVAVNLTGSSTLSPAGIRPIAPRRSQIPRGPFCWGTFYPAAKGARISMLVSHCWPHRGALFFSSTRDLRHVGFVSANPLAKGFPLSAGQINIVVPTVTPRKTYIVARECSPPPLPFSPSCDVHWLSQSSAILGILAKILPLKIEKENLLPYHLYFA